MLHAAQYQQALPKQAPLRACLWTRVSTQEQAEGGRAGLDRQREAVRRVAESKAYAVVETIELIDVSGTAVLQAPETRALIARMERRELDVLVAAEFSRIIRPDDLSSFSFLEQCRKNGVTLDCGGTVHDLDQPEGYLAGGLQALLAGHERKQMLRKVMSAKERKREKGHHPGASVNLPTGVSYDRKTEAYSHSADIQKVIEAFRIVDEEGLRNLTEIGRRVGIKAHSVRNVLSNPIYRGERVYDEMRDPNKKVVRADGRQGDRPKIKRAPDKIIRVRVYPPEKQAVSDERWHRVQAVLAGITLNREVVVAETWVGNMLAGVGRCSYCGERLYAKTSSRAFADGSCSRGHYICRSHHESVRRRDKLPKCRQPWSRKEPMEEVLEAFLLKLLHAPEFCTAVLAQAQVKRAEKVVDFGKEASLQAKLTDLSSRDKRLVEGLEAGVLTVDEVRVRRASLADERKAVMALHGPETVRDVEVVGDLSTITSLSAADWHALTSVRQQKEFLKRIFSEVYFQGEAITSFKLAPTLVPSSAGVWGYATQVPVHLEKPFRLVEPPVVVEVPNGHKQCSRCKEVKTLEHFYADLRAACRECSRKRCKTAHRRKVEQQAE